MKWSEKMYLMHKSCNVRGMQCLLGEDITMCLKDHKQLIVIQIIKQHLEEEAIKSA